MSLQNGLSPRGGPHWQCTWIPESYGQACEWQSYNEELRKAEMSTKWQGAQGGPTVWTFGLCSQRSPGLHVLRFEPMDDPYTPSPSYGVSSLGFIQTIKLLFLPVLLVKTCMLLFHFSGILLSMLSKVDAGQECCFHCHCAKCWRWWWRER